MQIRPAIQLQGIMKTMKDNVLPAIDPNNKVAIEQTNLILGTLSLMLQRIDLEYRYDCDELQRLLGFSNVLIQQTKGGLESRSAIAELEIVTAQCEDVLDRARVEPKELLKAVRSLRAKVSEVIMAIFLDGEAESKKAIREGVLAHAKEQLLRERSWFIQQGWEPDSEKVPAIESLLKKLH
ncbi:MAG: hypothetical protein RBT11_20295 [Desulfobacterales bacterium]|jgi:hypothetical protein|nr:hypothetical protein [Desulfobacterales bacterium]